jgi:riboflavin-specific deaminase-like protein
LDYDTKYRYKMRPKIVFNSAMSLDGRTKCGEEGCEFLSRLDRYRVHELRGYVDAVMVDVDSIILNDPALGFRTATDKKEPYKIIVDAKADVPETAKILSEPGKKLIVVSKDASSRKVEKLAKMEGVEIMTCGDYAVNLNELLDRLYDTGISALLLEGAGGLVRRMFSEGYVDEIYLAVIPTILGKGPEVFEKELPAEIKLDLDGILQYGDQIVLHYLVKK